MAPEQRAEAALRAPDAVTRRVDVHEEAQDPGAVRGAVRARVDVHELVARARLELATLLLDRAEARGAERPARDVVGCRTAQKRLDALSVRAQDALDPVTYCRIGLEAWNTIRFRVIADVLNLELTRQPGPHELEVVLARQLDGAALPEHD